MKTFGEGSFHIEIASTPEDVARGVVTVQCRLAISKEMQAQFTQAAVAQAIAGVTVACTFCGQHELTTTMRVIERSWFKRSVALCPACVAVVHGS